MILAIIENYASSTTQERKELYEFIYGQMKEKDFESIRELKILPSKKLQQAMISNGISENQLKKLVDAYHKEQNKRQNDIIKFLNEEELEFTSELFYLEIDDLIKEFLKNIIENEILLKTTYDLICTLINNNHLGENNITILKKFKNLLLPKMIREKIKKSLDKDPNCSDIKSNFCFINLPTKEYLDLILDECSDQMIANEIFKLFIKCIPKSIENRKEYQDLKAYLIEKYDIDTKYVFTNLSTELIKYHDLISTNSPAKQDKTAEPITRVGKININGREIIFRFVGTEHLTPKTFLSAELRKKCSESDHFFYEGMSGLRTKHSHEGSISNFKYRFNELDKPLLKRIAKLYKNSILEEKGEAEEDLLDYISLSNLRISTEFGTTLESIEHDIKNLFKAQNQTMLEEDLLRNEHLWHC